ncbi:MAG TPA: polynucleotide adenylyltransferase PcnB [Polyangiaceae bacterium]|nr:polynucleotide adenylyltransferase PcnB [Polyangiaceae bacterium]
MHRPGKPEEAGDGARSSAHRDSGAAGAAVTELALGAPKPMRSPKRNHGVNPMLHRPNIEESRIDADAAKVVRRLNSQGYEAYLVGGCVRDLLLNRAPKDFDVATSALPEDVRAVFRNSRVIGRRFRLVHVLFSRGKVIETATFRRPPSADTRGAEPRTGASADEELLIRSDNVFGCADEDALRRDFTINALFYDVQRREVLDWCGGMEDIERRVVRTIGEPVVRFMEDPIRILRAIKFSARLDLGIEPEVWHAMVQCRNALTLAAKPRLFEELLRLMRGGAAQRSVWLMWESGVLDVLLPELASYLADRKETDRTSWLLLRQVDDLTKKRGEPVDDVVLWGALLLEPLLEACAGSHDWGLSAQEFLDPIAERLNVPRRISDALRRIVCALPRIDAGQSSRFARSHIYTQALELLQMRREADPDAILPAPRRKRRRAS